MQANVAVEKTTKPINYALLIQDIHTGIRNREDIKRLDTSENKKQQYSVLDKLKIQALQRVAVLWLLREENILSLTAEQKEKLSEKWEPFTADFESLLNDIDQEYQDCDNEIQKGTYTKDTKAMLAEIMRKLGWRFMGDHLGRKYHIKLNDILAKNHKLLVKHIN